MHEFTDNFPEYGVLGNPDIPGPIELALYSADRGYSRKLGFREGAFSETELPIMRVLGNWASGIGPSRKLTYSILNKNSHCPGPKGIVAIITYADSARGLLTSLLLVDRYYPRYRMGRGLSTVVKGLGRP